MNLRTLFTSIFKPKAAEPKPQLKVDVSADQQIRALLDECLLRKDERDAARKDAADAKRIAHDQREKCLQHTAVSERRNRELAETIVEWRERAGKAQQELADLRFAYDSLAAEKLSLEQEVQEHRSTCAGHIAAAAETLDNLKLKLEEVRCYARDAQDAREVAERRVKELEAEITDIARSRGVQLGLVKSPDSDAPAAKRELIQNSETEGHFEIVRLSFLQKNKWFFTDGNIKFTAEIVDKQFLEKVDRRELSFAHGDVARVLYNVKGWRDEKGHLSSEYRVLTVLEVLPPPTQTPLLEGAAAGGAN